MRFLLFWCWKRLIISFDVTRTLGQTRRLPIFVDRPLRRSHGKAASSAWDSQRPSELSPTVLAQCNSFLLHRIVNDVDQNLVRRLVPDALGGLLGELPTLPSQQAILLGWAVPTPVLLKVRDLPKPQCPRSHDPKFWDTWLGNSGAQPDWAAIAASWENSAVDSNQSEDTDGGCQN